MIRIYTDENGLNNDRMTSDLVQAVFSGSNTTKASLLLTPHRGRSVIKISGRTEYVNCHRPSSYQNPELLLLRSTRVVSRIQYDRTHWRMARKMADAYHQSGTMPEPVCDRTGKSVVLCKCVCCSTVVSLWK